MAVGAMMGDKMKKFSYLIATLLVMPYVAPAFAYPGPAPTSTLKGGTGVSAVSLDAAGLVTKAGTQTITGAKTFSTAPALFTALGTASGGTGAANLNALIQTTGDQSMSGKKTFTTSIGLSTVAFTPNGYFEVLDASGRSQLLFGDATDEGSIFANSSHAGMFYGSRQVGGVNKARQNNVSGFDMTSGLGGSLNFYQLTGQTPGSTVSGLPVFSIVGSVPSEAIEAIVNGGSSADQAPILTLNRPGTTTKWRTWADGSGYYNFGLNAATTSDADLVASRLMYLNQTGDLTLPGGALDVHSTFRARQNAIIGQESTGGTVLQLVNNGGSNACHVGDSMTMAEGNGLSVALGVRGDTSGNPNFSDSTTEGDGQLKSNSASLFLGGTNAASGLKLDGSRDATFGHNVTIPGSLSPQGYVNGVGSTTSGGALMSVYGGAGGPTNGSYMYIGRGDGSNNDLEMGAIGSAHGFFTTSGTGDAFLKAKNGNLLLGSYSAAPALVLYSSGNAAFSGTISGDGSGLTGLASSALVGNLPAIGGSSLTSL